MIVRELKTTRLEYRTVVCPDCNAQVGKKCTTPTDFGRRAIEIIHFARERAYEASLR